MKLTEEDRQFLREEFFEDERSILQIEKAIKKTIFEIDGKRISADEAISLIGRRNFLCGMDRCAFHVDAVQHTLDGKDLYFDSRPYFKEKPRRRGAR